MKTINYNEPDEVLEELAPGEEESMEHKETRLRLAAQELKHRYRSIESWIEATEIYREYAYFLIENMVARSNTNSAELSVWQTNGSHFSQY